MALHLCPHCTRTGPVRGIVVGNPLFPGLTSPPPRAKLVEPPPLLASWCLHHAFLRYAPVSFSSSSPFYFGFRIGIEYFAKTNNDGPDCSGPFILLITISAYWTEHSFLKAVVCFSSWSEILQLVISYGIARNNLLAFFLWLYIIPLR